MPHTPVASGCPPAARRESGEGKLSARSGASAKPGSNWCLVCNPLFLHRRASRQSGSVPWSNRPSRILAVCPPGTLRWFSGYGLEHCKWLRGLFVSVDAPSMSAMPVMRGSLDRSFFPPGPNDIPVRVLLFPLFNLTGYATTSIACHASEDHRSVGRRIHVRSLSRRKEAASFGIRCAGPQSSKR